MDDRPTRARSTRRRGGSIYVAVLGVALLITMMGIGGVSANRSMARAVAAGADAPRARWAAMTGLEVAKKLIDQDASWRSNRASGAWVTNQAYGTKGVASYSISVTNPLGALNRSETDTVYVTATGKYGSCVHTIEAQLAADATAPTGLSCGAVAGGSITFTSATVQCSGAVIASNGAVTAALSTVNAKVEASLTVAGVTYTQTTTSLCAPRDLPGSSVFTTYLSAGTRIPISSIPQSINVRTISRVLISPSANPFSGGTNASGVYIIDAAGQDLSISDCRIVGTLVVLNPGSNSSVSGSVCWEPAVAGYPCLMVQGSAAIRTSSSLLSEGSGGGNFNGNPSGTPYPYFGGVSNAKNDDSFPSSIEGLVYVSGNLTTSGTVTVRNLVVGGSLTSGGTLNLNYDSTYAASPPPGFATIKMRQLLGGTRQVAQ